MTFTLPLGRAEIEAILPHRDSFLLIDEVTELAIDERRAQIGVVVSSAGGGIA